MRKFTYQDSPTFSARLYPAEIQVLKDMADAMDLRGVADLLHQLASAEAIVTMIAADTSGEMTATAKRIRKLLETMSADDYDALNQVMSGVSAALDRAAKIRAEFEQAEAGEVADDYKDRKE